MRVLVVCLLAACVDATVPAEDTEPVDDDTATVQADLATGCKKMIHVTLRTNYGIEAFDPTRVVPNRCWIDRDQVENLNSREWRRCGADKCEPTTDKTHWYYDDTAMFTTAQDKADIARVHSGMGAIKGTVDMANRGAGWNYFNMDAGGYHDIIDRWFAETHSAVGDHAGCQFQENDYIDEWLKFPQRERRWPHPPSARRDLVGSSLCSGWSRARELPGRVSTDQARMFADQQRAHARHHRRGRLEAAVRPLPR